MESLERLPNIELARELPPVADGKANIARILSAHHRDSRAKDALVALSVMPEAEALKAVRVASEYVSEGGRRSQYHLAGNFVDEKGVPRNREIFTVDPPELLEKFPFLRYLALKLVPDSKQNERELKMHLAIQESAEQDKDFPLEVPRIVSVFRDSASKEIGIVMERLQRNEANASLQDLIAMAKRDKIALRISDSVASGIETSFGNLHSLGYLHGDINDGNIYLSDCEFKDYTLPRPKDRIIRPSKMRIIYKARPILLDFERTEPIPRNDIETNPLVTKETDLISAMTESVALPIGEDAGLEDIVEASDEYYEQRRAG